MYVINTDKIPIISWCPDADENAIEQMKILTSLPFVRYAAMMADTHLGQNMPIGGVLACDGVVIPDAVGSDVGCGMCAVKTSLNIEDFSMDARWRYLDSMEKVIPVGFSHNDQKKVQLLRSTMGDKFDYDISKSGIDKASINPIKNIEESYFGQIGTLGGGNHMAELDIDCSTGDVWILIHSGSRNIGKRIGDQFNEVASSLNSKFYSSVPKQIAFLPTDSPEGVDYLRWMEFALMFAFRNRQLILSGMQNCFKAEFPNIGFDKPINIHHNYASLERHLGRDLWVHRKGATLASEGITGIIPGSMGTFSYIVLGKGNHKSLNSCSHGAGRKFGRVEFNKNNNNEQALADIEKAMEGIVYRKFKKDINRKGKETGMIDVAESPGAYKDIVEVISNQADLVDPIVKMKPIVVMKG